jgi:hypothetical protein
LQLTNLNSQKIKAYYGSSRCFPIYKEKPILVISSVVISAQVLIDYIFTFFIEKDLFEILTATSFCYSIKKETNIHI